MKLNKDGAHELALKMINDGHTYTKRCEIGRKQRTNSASPMIMRECAFQWMQIAINGAREYEHEFGSRGASCFTVADILGAARELAEHHETHTCELDAIEWRARNPA